MESCAAMCSPGIALVAPGPRVTKQIPGRPVKLAIGLRHHRRAPFRTARQHVDAGIRQCVQDGQIAFARHAGGTVDALDDELIDQQARGGSGMGQGHAGGSGFDRAILSGTDGGR